MTRFDDGPAAGQTLMLRRAPPFLRVVQTPAGQWDALDELHDTPAPDEVVVAYKRVGPAGSVHIDGIDPKTRRRFGRWFAIARYVVCDPQPAEAVLRSTAEWRVWCLANAQT